MKKYIKNQTQKHSGRSGKRHASDLLKIICWLLAPLAMAALLVLDALGIYVFSTERLLVLGVGLLVILLPFFAEIKFQNLHLKRGDFHDQ